VEIQRRKSVENQRTSVAIVSNPPVTSATYINREIFETGGGRRAVKRAVGNALGTAGNLELPVAANTLSGGARWPTGWGDTPCRLLSSISRLDRHAISNVEPLSAPPRWWGVGEREPRRASALRRHLRTPWLGLTSSDHGCRTPCAERVGIQARPHQALGADRSGSYTGAELSIRGASGRITSSAVHGNAPLGRSEAGSASASLAPCWGIGPVPPDNGQA
jgi:hypothetical protein